MLAVENFLVMFLHVNRGPGCFVALRAGKCELLKESGSLVHG